MARKVTVQIQSILYCNEKESVHRTIMAVINAIRVAKEYYDLNITATYVCGDASPTPIFSEKEILNLQQEVGFSIDLKYTFFNKNTGSAMGHNIIAPTTDSEFILIMNPDIKLSPHYFYYALLPFLTNEVGMVEARQTPIEHSKKYNMQTLETEWATTACAIVRRKIFKELEGFDAKTFFLYCDDVDFSWRMRLAGYRIIYQPLAPVFHAKTLDSNGAWVTSSAERYYSALAAMLMAYKWSNEERANYLYKMYMLSPIEEEQSAARKFKKLKRRKSLPKQLDAEHKVSRFEGDFYCKHRFIMTVGKGES